MHKEPPMNPSLRHKHDSNKFNLIAIVACACSSHIAALIRAHPDEWWERMNNDDVVDVIILMQMAPTLPSWDFIFALCALWVGK